LPHCRRPSAFSGKVEGEPVKESPRSADDSYVTISPLKTRPNPAHISDRDRLRAQSHKGEIAAVVVERNDGTCTVLWAGIWRTFSSRPEEWETRRRAMDAVDTVVGDILIWNEMAPYTWAARAA
jgi:hypothetical protein